MTGGRTTARPRVRVLRVTATLAVSWCGMFLGLVVTGVLIFGLGVPLPQNVGRVLSALLGAGLAVLFVRSSWQRWLAEDARA